MFLTPCHSNAAQPRPLLTIPVPKLAGQCLVMHFEYYFKKFQNNTFSKTGLVLRLLQARDRCGSKGLTTLCIGTSRLWILAF